MGLPTGQQIADVESKSMLAGTQVQKGTATNAGFVATGTIVAICGYTFSGGAAGDTFTIEDGAGNDLWTVEIEASDLVELEFNHPLIADGLGVVVAGGGSYRWNLQYKLIGPPAT